jgi:tetratricopeptide (TPR) repeat protein
MFFMRLRRSAKWAFIVLIFAFAFSFLFAGVGSGSGSGDLISGLLGLRGGNPVKSAEKNAAENPKDANALTKLAQAYDANNRRAAAIKTYRKYLKLKPKDPSGLTQLGRLQEEIATLRWDRYAALQSKLAVVSDPLSPDPLQTLAGADYLLTSYTTLLSTKLSNAYGSYTVAAQAWESTTKSYAKAVPATNTLPRALAEYQVVQVELQLAQNAGSAADYATAIKSYRTAIKFCKRFLRLTPKSPLAKQVKKLLADLQKVTSSS